MRKIFFSLLFLLSLLMMGCSYNYLDDHGSGGSSVSGGVWGYDRYYRGRYNHHRYRPRPPRPVRPRPTQLPL